MNQGQVSMNAPGNTYLVAGASSTIGMALIDIILQNEPKAILYLLARNTEKLSRIYDNVARSQQLHIIPFDLLHIHYPLQPEWGINYAVIFPGTIPGNIEQYADSLKVNFSGIVQLTEQLIALYPETLKNIMVTTSTAGIRVRKNNYIYGSAKAGLIGYCSGLRHLLASRIHVTTLIPGPVKTEMLNGIQVNPYLLVTPASYAKKIYSAVFRHKNFVYSSWQWRVISWLLKILPEALLLSMSYEMKNNKS